VLALRHWAAGAPPRRPVASSALMMPSSNCRCPMYSVRSMRRIFEETFGDKTLRSDFNLAHGPFWLQERRKKKAGR
jgi:hypothetical protein